MHGLKGERVLMRIHIGERDKFENEPLHWAIVQLLRQRHFAGATVTRGMMGFGAGSRIHSARFIDFAVDLPVVIECVETEEKINEILPVLDEMVGGGLITLEKVNVIAYRPAENAEQSTAEWPAQTTGTNPIN